MKRHSGICWKSRILKKTQYYRIAAFPSGLYAFWVLRRWIPTFLRAFVSDFHSISLEWWGGSLVTSLLCCCVSWHRAKNQSGRRQLCQLQSQLPGPQRCRTCSTERKRMALASDNLSLAANLLYDCEEMPQSFIPRQDRGPVNSESPGLPRCKQHTWDNECWFCCQSWFLHVHLWQNFHAM